MTIQEFPIFQEYPNNHEIFQVVPHSTTTHEKILSKETKPISKNFLKALPAEIHHQHSPQSHTHPLQHTLQDCARPKLPIAYRTAKPIILSLHSIAPNTKQGEKSHPVNIIRFHRDSLIYPCKDIPFFTRHCSAMTTFKGEQLAIPG